MKKIKYVLIFIISMFLFKLDVFGLTLKRNVTNYYYYIENNETKLSNKISTFKDGDNQLYCIEPLANVITLEYSKTTNINENLQMDQSTIDLIKKIIYFGYLYEDHDDILYFLATQELIWEKSSDYKVDWYTGINKTGNKVDVEKEKQIILELIENSNKIPSFISETYKGGIGKSIIIEDTNNIISEFQQNDTDIEIFENKVKINFNSLGYKSVPIYRNFSQNTGTYLYVSDNSQKFIYSEGINSKMTTINYETLLEYGNLNIKTKYEKLVGYEEKFIFEEKDFSNVEYSLYAFDNIYDIYGNILYYKDEKIADLITNNNGNIDVELNFGSYYIKQSKIVQGYINDSNKYIFTLDDNNVNQNFEFIFKLKNTIINLTKKIEILTEYFSYEYIPKENIEFGLYLNEDVYVDNNIILKKDTLIQTYFTSFDGTLKIELLLPYQKYYIKEISTLPLYVENNEKYEFEINDVMEEDYIQIDIKEITNYLKKYDLEINNYDNCLLNPVANNEFELYKDGNLINLYFTDNNGILYLEDISIGTYLLKEKNSSKEYEFILNKNTKFDIITEYKCIQEEPIDDDTNIESIDEEKNIDEDINIKEDEFDIEKDFQENIEEKLEISEQKINEQNSDTTENRTATQQDIIIEQIIEENKDVNYQMPYTFGSNGSNTLFLILLIVGSILVFRIK